jgi:hypothetical protein
LRAGHAGDGDGLPGLEKLAASCWISWFAGAFSGFSISEIHSRNAYQKIKLHACHY